MRAVRATAQRGEQALGIVLVEVDALRLLAGVAAGDRVATVPAYPRDVPPVRATELDLDPAVALAEETGGGAPVGAVHGGLGFHMVAYRNQMRTRFADANCSVAQALDVLGDGWTLLVLREAFLGTRRFADFERELGIAKNILSDRLDHLVAHEVLERVEVGVRGSRQEYVLTPRGRDLVVILTALRQWGDRWLTGPGNEPLLVLDRRTGRPIPRLRIRGEDGQPLRGEDFVVVPGPGASEESRGRFGEPRQDGE